MPKTRADDGGPAFPSPGTLHNPFQPGMSLRDWFAGQALAGLIPGYATAYGSPSSAIDEVCQEAWNYADAMLAVRDAK